MAEIKTHSHHPSLAQGAADGELIDAVRIEGTVVAPNLIFATYVAEPAAVPHCALQSRLVRDGGAAENR